jgi:TolB protein
VGGAASGVLTPGDEDCFTVVVPAAATAGRITAWTSGDTDTYGILYDSSYDWIDENDDGFHSSPNFHVTHHAASPGRYYIRVRGYDSDESGQYTIHVDDHGGSIESATVEWVPVTFDGVANAGSIAAPDNRDFFALSLYDDALVGLGTTGGTDTYGTLYDDDGARVAEDNDGGPGRNFRIERRLEAGDYFIEVQGFGNSTGSYELVAIPVAERHSGYPAWSPDGSRIAFTSDRDGSVDIYAMNADGSGVTRLTNDRSWDLLPKWSPDGSRIALMSNRDALARRDGDFFLNFQIHVMNTDGSGIMRLTGNSEWYDGFPAWSPDGSKIAFASNRDASELRDDDLVGTRIYVMDADGSGVTRLTGGSEASDYSPAWSPDGSRIAFTSDRDDSGRFNSHIYVMNADGSGVTRLTGNSEWDDGFPAWSPDGSRIAFTSDRDDSGRVSSGIYVMNADGSGVTRLTGGSEWEDALPAWSPDGSRIAFMSARDGNFEIYVMDADGTGVRRLTTTSAAGDAADGPLPAEFFGGAGRASWLDPARKPGVHSREGAAAAERDALLGPVRKQPVLKKMPSRRRGQRR